MKFDARKELDSDKQQEFVTWLAETTAKDFSRSRGNREQLKTAVFLYLNRAYEAHLDPDIIVNLLGIVPENIMSAAELDNVDEESILEFYELLDPTISGTYGC